MIIEELRPIIEMQLFDRERQPLKHLLEGHFHRLIASSQEHHALTPAGGHIDQLQRVPILSCRALSSMMHQIRLEVSWISRIPGNTSHRHAFGHLIGAVWSFARQTRFARTVLAQHPLHRCRADRRQVALHLCCQDQ
jgi:hypothetical protein